MKGSGIFFNSPEKSNQPFIKILQKAQKSEKELIEEYNKYVKIYKKHISDLDALDNYVVEDNYNFDSFRKSFEMIESQLNDKKNPLLLTNYTDVPKNDFSDDIIEYHLLQQIKYLLENNYNDEDRELIKLVSIRNVKTSPEFKVFSYENKSTEYLPVFHHKFQLDYSKMKDIFDQIIKYMNDNVGVLQKIKSNLKQKSITKIKSPNVNPLKTKTKTPIIKSDSPIRKTTTKPTTKATTKKTTKAKSKSKQKKNIEDINLPLNNNSLPVVEIKIPKKISKA